MAVPFLKLPFVGISPATLSLDAKAVPVGYVVDEVTLGYVQSCLGQAEVILTPLFQNSVGYHMSVTRLPTQKDVQEEVTKECTLCPEAVRRTLSTMLDMSLLRSPTFLLLSLSGFITMMGFYVPFMYVTGESRVHDNCKTDTSPSLYCQYTRINEYILFLIGYFGV